MSGQLVMLRDAYERASACGCDACRLALLHAARDTLAEYDRTRTQHPACDCPVQHA
jgi:hypothetical protein